MGNKCSSQITGNELLSNLCDDGGLVPSEVLRQLAKLEGDLDQALEPVLGIPHQLLLVRVRVKVPFDVHPDGRSLTSGTRQPPDDTRSILESDDLSLILADASVNRVGVVEIVGPGDLEGGTSRLGLVHGADERAGGNRLLEFVDKLMGGSGLDFLIIVTGEEGTTVDLVVSQENIIDADEFVGRCLVSSGKNVEPSWRQTSASLEEDRRIAQRTDHRPYTILLTDVVRTCTERFLAANGESTSIHQVSEELPA